MIPNMWYAVLPSTAVSRGKITAVKRMDLELAFFRNHDGKACCVLDQCSHRGAALSKGSVQGDCIACPFHGLQFDGNGRCTLIPANGRASAEDLSRFHVRQFALREAHGIIYLWNGEAKEADLQQRLPFFDENLDDSWVFSELEDPWNSHYSRCIENQLDVVHLPFVHATTIGRGNKTVVNGPRIEPCEGGFRTSANNETDQGQKPRKAAECEIRPTYLQFLFPNLWMNHISDRIKVVIFFAPVDGENTVLYIRFYCKLAGSRLMNRIIAQPGKWANRVIERQDKRVVITQKPKASSFRSQEKLLSGDGPVILYRKMRDEMQKKAEQKSEN